MVSKFNELHCDASRLADGNVNDEGAAALMDGVRQSKGLQKFEYVS